MSEFPSMPLWTDAYLADCGHLTDAEHGRYLLILMAMWRAPGVRLPDDDEWLAKRFRRSVDDVRSQLRPLISEFCKISRGWITQKRLVEEFEFLKKSREKQSIRAKARWKKEKDECRGNATPHASGNASSGNALSTPTPIEEDILTDVRISSKSKRSSPSPDRQIEADHGEWYAVYPRKEDPGKSLRAYRGARKKASADVLLAGAERYRDECVGKDPQFIKLPASWLNAESWKNERSPVHVQQPSLDGLVIDQHGNVDQRGAENPRSRPGRAGPASVAAALDQISAAQKTGGSGW